MKISVVYFLQQQRVHVRWSAKNEIIALILCIVLYIIITVLYLNHLNELTIFFKTGDFWVLHLLPHLLNQLKIETPWALEPKHHHDGASNGPASLLQKVRMVGKSSNHPNSSVLMVNHPNSTWVILYKKIPFEVCLSLRSWKMLEASGVRISNSNLDFLLGHWLMLDTNCLKKNTTFPVAKLFRIVQIHSQKCHFWDFCFTIQKRDPGIIWC